MIIAAFVLLLLVALGVLWLLVGASGGPSIQIESGPLDVMMSATSLFLFGAVSALLVCLAIWMLRSGTARNLRNRRERKNLEKRADEAEQERERALREKKAADAQAAKSRVAARDAEQAQRAEQAAQRGTGPVATPPGTSAPDRPPFDGPGTGHGGAAPASDDDLGGRGRL